MLTSKSLLSVPLALMLPYLANAIEVPGPQVADRTQKVLKQMPWAASLKAAQEKAAQEKKLVFWLQLVGDLDGGL